MSLTLERPSTTSDLQVHPVTPILGAEGTGIDLRSELDAGTAARFRPPVGELFNVIS